MTNSTVKTYSQDMDATKTVATSTRRSVLLLIFFLIAALVVVIDSNRSVYAQHLASAFAVISLLIVQKAEQNRNKQDSKY